MTLCRPTTKHITGGGGGVVQGLFHRGNFWQGGGGCHKASRYWPVGGGGDFAPRESQKSNCLTHTLTCKSMLRSGSQRFPNQFESEPLAQKLCLKKMQTVICETDSVERKYIEGHTVWMCRKKLLAVNATFDVPERSVVEMVHESKRGG